MILQNFHISATVNQKIQGIYELHFCKYYDYIFGQEYIQHIKDIILAKYPLGERTTTGEICHRIEFEIRKLIYEKLANDENVFQRHLELFHKKINGELES